MNKFGLCCFLLSFLLVGQVLGQIKWDDKTLGVKFVKPEKGRLWTVAITVEGTEGAKLQPGDEIMEVNDKKVSVDDDLLAVIRDSDDVVKIRAKRKVPTPNGKRTKTVVDETTFTKQTYWQVTRDRFESHRDELEGFEILTHAQGKKVLADQTHFMPSIVFVDEEPKTVRLYFQFRSDDWLFIENITFKVGEQRWELSPQQFRLKTEVLSGGQIKEWFITVDPAAEEILAAVAKDTGAPILIRLNGMDYYRDITLSEGERNIFSDTNLLLTLARQRQASLKE